MKTMEEVHQEFLEELRRSVESIPSQEDERFMFLLRRWSRLIERLRRERRS